MGTEADLMRLIVRELSHGNVRLFRNQVGAYKDGDRYIRFGLAVGSGDLIGIKAEKHYVDACLQFQGVPLIFDKLVGRFICIEVKRPGQHATPEQQNFIDTIKKLGGLAGVAHSVEEAREILNAP